MTESNSVPGSTPHTAGDSAPVRPQMSPWMLIGGTVVGLFAGLLVLGLVIALVMGKQKIVVKRGIAEVELPDKTWLVIEDVTFGNRHRLVLPQDQVPWWEFGARMSRPREVNHYTGDNRMVVWMSHLSQDKKQPVDPTWWLRTDVVDARGRVIPDENARRHIEYQHGSGSTSGERPFDSVLTTMPHARDFRQIIASSDFQAIRAQDGKFQLIVTGSDNKEVARFDLKYPGPAATSSWKPIALPASSTLGDLELTVQEMKATVATIARHKSSSTHFGSYKTMQDVVKETTWPESEIRVRNVMNVYPAFEIKRDGKVITDWNVHNYELMDEIGNRSNWNHALDPRDAAWKLTGNIARNSQAHFTPDEVWTLKPLTIPEAGKAQAVTETGKLHGFDLACIAIGRGNFTHNWSTSATYNSNSSYGTGFEGESANMHLEQEKGSAKLKVEANMPHFVTKTSKADFPRWVQIVRATSPSGAAVKVSHPHQLGEFSVYFIDPKYTEKEINLEFIIHESRPFEFYVPPPPVPKELEEEYPPLK